MNFRNFIHISSQNEGTKLLRQLSKINKPLEIKFKEMLNLMNQCEVVEKQNNHKIQTRSNDREDEETFMNRQYPLFSGIVPGRFLFFFLIQNNSCVIIFFVLVLEMINMF